MIHVSSRDVTTGNSYNGTFTLSGTVSGTLSLLDYYIEPVDFPWLFSPYNTIVVSFYSDNLTNYSGTIQFSLSSLSSQDGDDIAASIQADIRNASLRELLTSANGFTLDYVVYANSTVTYDSVNNRLAFNWAIESTPVTNAWYSSILWDTGASEASVMFGITEDQTPNVTNGTNGSGDITFTTYVSLANLITNSPTFVYMLIDEALDLGRCTTLVKPTFVICNEDKVSGGYCELRNSINTFTISFLRPDFPYGILPFTGAWDLILSQQ